MSEAIPEVWDVVDFKTGEVYLNEVTALEAFNWFTRRLVLGFGRGYATDFWIHSVESYPNETETCIYNTVFVAK